jgi:hypothetical protein
MHGHDSREKSRNRISAGLHMAVQKKSIWGPGPSPTDVGADRWAPTAGKGVGHL